MNDRVPGGASGEALAVADAERTRARCVDLLSQLRPAVALPSQAASEAFRSAFEELRDLPSDCASDELVECLLLIVHYLYMDAQPGLGLVAARKATDFARLSASPTLLRKSLSIFGIMLVETGDLPSATEALLEALEIARSIGDPAAEAPVWNNLGLALQNAAQYGEALSCFERAATLAKGSSEFGVVENIALTNIANCAIHLHEVRRGVKAVRAAIELNNNPSSASDCLIRVFAESSYARLLLEIGDIGDAEEHLSLALAYAAKAPSARAVHQAAVITGLVDVHASRTDIGLTRLKRSLEHARSAVPSDVPEALSACIAGYEAAGQPDVALVYLHELLALNREGRAARILAPFELLAREVGGNRVADRRSDQLMTNQAAKLVASIDKCIGDLVAAAVDNALRAGHDPARIFRVGRLAELFALSMGWSQQAASELAFVVRLMDVGSIVVPDALWRKPRGLSAGERKLVAEHTGYGAELLQRARLVLLQPCVAVAKFHHERWDGAGPWGLSGEAIPVEARIAAMADTLDALTHARPWRPANSIQAALDDVAADAGQRFDPVLAERFVEFVKAEFWRCNDWDEHLSADAHDNAYVRARAQLDRLIASGDEA